MSVPAMRQLELFPFQEGGGQAPMRPTTPRGVRKPRLAVAPEQAMDVCVLGSGSGGNSTVVAYRGQAMLIDAGFGPLSTARRLERVGLSLQNVRSICLTHLDQDHFRPQLIPTLLGWSIRVFLHRFNLADWRRRPGGDEMCQAGLVEVFDDRGFEPLPAIHVDPLRLRHDAQGTSGFRIASPVGSVGYATDLGQAPQELIERFTGVDLLALESNYDPQMQVRSSRPEFLKRRIMGGAGHLSNEQSFAAIRAIFDRSGEAAPSHVVLLHRSRQCNCPNLVRALFGQDPRLGTRLTLAEQSRPTRWFHILPRERPQQPGLFALPGNGQRPSEPRGVSTPVGT